MQPFTHYNIKQTENGVEIVLYLDQNLAEFSDELGNVSKSAESNMKGEAVSFVKRMFPSLKVKSVKIMAGAMLLTTFGIGTLTTSEVSAAESTVSQSQTMSQSYRVSAGDTLYKIATKNGTTVEAIKQANGLTSNNLQIGQTLTIPTRGTTTPVQSKSTSYQVVSGDTLYKIATENGTTVDAIKQANGLTSNNLQVGQTLTIPTGGTTTPVQSKSKSYQVVRGDTLYKIATENGTTVDSIKQANGLTSNNLQIGQTLTIPTGGTTTPVQSKSTSYQVVPGDTLYKIATQNGTTVYAIKQANGLTTNNLQVGQMLTIPTGGTAPVQSKSTTYQVVPGDTLYKIATQNGTTVDAIKQANRLTSNNLQIGQTLTIPSGASLAMEASSEIATPKAEQPSEVNQEDLEWLAKMIYSEGRGESLEGQIAVGAVIMNRVKSPLFPNKVKDVLFEKSYGYYQFTPAETGAINSATPNAQNREAARRAMNGEDPTNGALFFYNPKKTSSAYLRSREVSTVIGGHVFAY
ncbi:LysM peptidoglycan-binding domain-containing protein [Oceanobacillus halophilus]|uniref:LysM peptidoglycan-binding domain-containing protein n=1 Tax=Oceanobacillus halophilus TaxID=930130 RepID=A0A495A7J8_9BACI|nr:LysM peptidoglycan-binding domain-containing protein [Oceanobacillus halophilus]RKQ34324.1 LysM peptidoglycan-binding domain-containing protein [Oceanobacillus halophilus]